MKFHFKVLMKDINQFCIDAIIFSFSLFAAYLIRFEGIIPGIVLKQFLTLLPYIVIARIVLFQIFSVYKIVWRYISIQDALRMIKGLLPVTGLLSLARYLLPAKLFMLKVPISIIVLEFLLVTLGTLGMRMIRRIWAESAARNGLTQERQEIIKKILLIGAGDAGNLVVKELKQRVDLGFHVVGFIDDDPHKLSTVIQGIRVLGNSAAIPRLAGKYKIDEAIISIANASSRDIRNLVEICEGAGIKVRIIPGLFELLDGRVTVNAIREVKIEDLLGRNIVKMDPRRSEVVQHYRGRKIMVTGAGGSIGSELCRQLCMLKPSEIVLVDKDENSIFEIDNELQGRSAEIRVVPLIANIKNQTRLAQIFAKNKPDIIFHAAAHKHVPLMERNVSEAILNNVKGTVELARLADLHHIEKFIFISSDKAVNPTSVMGATKRIGEMIIQDIASKSATQFSCVRFGNVLGSRGSVIPLFQKQIARGGPVTITHPDMRRFFMSISEAVQLIIQAGSIGSNGEILVLDMGKMVPIVGLAKDLIRLSGFNEEDVEIRFTGLRPGEKLYEEILVDQERDQTTTFEKIFIAPPTESDLVDIQKWVETLIGAAERSQDEEIVRCFREMNIGYQGKWRTNG